MVILTQVGQLVKFKLSLLVVISSVLAYVISVINVGAYTQAVWLNALVLGIAGFFITGASNALNQVLEVEYDKLMERTKQRPLVTNQLSSSFAILLAGVLTISGLGILSTFNLLCALLGAVALVLYAFVYTPLKRIGSSAVFVGAIPGALPMAIGSVAATGEFGLLAFLLFGFQFLWQFPHFMSIGVLSFEDYKKAGFKIVDTKGDSWSSSMGMEALMPSLLLFPLAYISFASGFLTIIGFCLVICASLIFAYYSWIFYIKLDKNHARRLLFASLIYLPFLLVVFLLFNHQV